MPPAISAKLEAVLLDNIASSNESVRLCAVQWASRLFPFAHPPARYVCVLGAGDKRFDVREEAARGLKPQAAPSKADKAKVRSSSAVGLESKGLESTPGFLQGEYRVPFPHLPPPAWPSLAVTHLRCCFMPLGQQQLRYNQ